MKNTKVIRLLVVSALCLAQVAAFADNGKGHDKGHGNGHGNGHGRDHDERGDSRSDRSSHENQQGDRRSHGDHEDRGRHEGERGGGPDHAFYRGERLPTYYRSQHYVVNNWHEHGLRSPPRGYHWVQTGGDYLLVAITTGIILELLLSR